MIEKYCWDISEPSALWRWNIPSSRFDIASALFPHRSSPLRSGKRYEEAHEVSSRRRLYILRQWYVTLSNINNFRIFLPRLFPPPPNRPVYPNVAQSGSTANCRRDNRFHFRSSPFTSLSLFPLFRLNERTRIQYTISVSITVGRVREIRLVSR